MKSLLSQNAFIGQKFEWADTKQLYEIMSIYPGSSDHYCWTVRIYENRGEVRDDTYHKASVPKSVVNWI